MGRDRSATLITNHRLAVCLAAVISFLPGRAEALPMYAQRSGRTCGNCHISPTYEDEQGWNNPQLSQRKCSMSCVTCHTNPGGGGLRNTSGRYYGQSTLSMFPMQERSYSDYDRELLPQWLIRVVRDFFAWEPAEPVTSETPADDSSTKRSIPSNYEQAIGGMGAGKRGGWSVLGRPLFGNSRMAFWDGRYGDLRADPLLLVGGDVRLAYWTGSRTPFPMQVDLHGAVHPIEHVTIMGTAAARGRAAGIQAVLEQDRTLFFPRNAFVMAHELPYMGYAKAGIFMPTFGTHLDDHTSFIRDYFEMDVSASEDTVLGVEIGAAPNYPHASLSVFRNFAPPGTPEEINRGWGMATSFGWRDLGWSVSGHAMIKRRALRARGDLEAGGIGWGFNPAYYVDAIPLTYMGEVTLGRRQQPVSGEAAVQIASYHELWWTLFNGILIKAKYDLGSRDLSGSGSLEQRWALALDVSPIPGLTLMAQGRLLQPRPSADLGWDVLIQTHLWF